MNKKEIAFNDIMLHVGDTLNFPTFKKARKKAIKKTKRYIATLEGMTYDTFFLRTKVDCDETSKDLLQRMGYIQPTQPMTTSEKAHRDIIEVIISHYDIEENISEKLFNKAHKKTLKKAIKHLTTLENMKYEDMGLIFERLSDTNVNKVASSEVNELMNYYVIPFFNQMLYDFTLEDFEKVKIKVIKALEKMKKGIKEMKAGKLICEAIDIVQNLDLEGYEDFRFSIVVQVGDEFLMNTKDKLPF